MTRRTRKDESGFTLIELLVVMIIIGILASIAIPVFLSQRGKAHDSATKADVSNLGKEVATYFVGGTGALVLDTSVAGQIGITDGSLVTFARLTVGSTLPTTNGSKNLGSATDWCVALTDPQGKDKTYRYTASSGLERGDCA